MIDIDKVGSVAESAAASVAVLAPVARFSLRAREAGRAALSGALGADLPVRIGECAAAGEMRVLCLGPDEWLVHAPEADAAGIATACEQVYAEAPHSLTGITDREVSLDITGPKAAELLTLGCPRNLDTLPVGEARRTVCDGASVVLWRDAEQAFRMDVWRSFAPHVCALLATGCTELAVE